MVVDRVESENRDARVAMPRSGEAGTKPREKQMVLSLESFKIAGGRKMGRLPTAGFYGADESSGIAAIPARCRVSSVCKN